MPHAQVLITPDVLAAAQEAVDAWAPMQAHPHLAVLRHAFASQSELGAAPSLCVAHTYYPGAVTLEQAHLQPSATGTGLVRSNNASEDTLWSYLVQVGLVETSCAALRLSFARQTDGHTHGSDEAPFMLSCWRA